MAYLDTLLPFLVCAALGFWAVLKFMPSKAGPAEKPLDKADPIGDEPPWSGGTAPHRFGHNPDEP